MIGQYFYLKKSPSFFDFFKKIIILYIVDWDNCHCATVWVYLLGGA